MFLYVQVYYVDKCIKIFCVLVVNLKFFECLIDVDVKLLNIFLFLNFNIGFMYGT